MYFPERAKTWEFKDYLMDHCITPECEPNP